MSYIPYIPGGAQDSGQAELAAFFAALSSTSAASNGTCCESGVLNIEKYIPYWIVKEKVDRGGDTLTIFDFIQKYYDWLYCSSDGCGGSGYILENKLMDIIDIDKTKELYYKKLFFSYFGDFDENEQVKDANGLVIDNQTVASFIKNIKPKFNERKGSIESLNLFFNKLFSVELGDIKISYPKEQIFRLNSGAFPSQYSGFTGQNSGTLNKYRFQDGNFFQDYSYTIHTGITLANSGYGPLYLRSLHPSGLRCMIEINIDDYVVTSPTQEVDVTQTPFLKNYSPYIMGITYSELSSGIYGLTHTTGCTTTFFAGPSPTSVFPSWSLGMSSYTTFGEIPINKMFQLNYNINTTNPNSTLTCP